MDAFGRRLQESRKKNKCTQKDLAKALGISRAKLQRWEEGKADPSIHEALAVADLLSVSAAYLFVRVNNC